MIAATSSALSVRGARCGTTSLTGGVGIGRALVTCLHRTKNQPTPTQNCRSVRHKPLVAS